METHRPTICMFTPSASGGHARYTQELLSALAQLGSLQGIDVSLATSGDLAESYRTPLYPIYDILPALRHRDSFPTALQWAVSRAMHYFRREQSFLHLLAVTEHLVGVHFQEYTPWLAPSHFRVLRARGKKLFFTVHNIYPHNYPPLVPKRWIDNYNRTAWRLCNALFVHTQGLREALSHFLGPGHPPIFVTPHGTWNSNHGTCLLGGAADDVPRKRLLFFGVIRPNKGLHLLIKAMKQLPEYTLVVAGSPEDVGYQESLGRLLADLPAGQVEMHDQFIEESAVGGFFERADLVVLPYTSFAAQSGVLHLAMAYARPVVSTNVGGMGESVAEWGVGKVVPPDNETLLACAIREAMEPSFYASARRAAGQVRQELSWERTAAMTLKVYRSILEERQ